jgi:hypothetical protein
MEFVDNKFVNVLALLLFSIFLICKCKYNGKDHCWHWKFAEMNECQYQFNIRFVQNQNSHSKPKENNPQAIQK